MINKPTDSDIYKIVSIHYKNEGLSPSSFSNRLYALKCIIYKEYSMKDAMNFLDNREHWWEAGDTNQKYMKERTKRQFHTILKKMGLKLSKDGLHKIK